MRRRRRPGVSTFEVGPVGVPGLVHREAVRPDGEDRAGGPGEPAQVARDVVPAQHHPGQVRLVRMVHHPGHGVGPDPPAQSAERLVAHCQRWLRDVARGGHREVPGQVQPAAAARRRRPASPPPRGGCAA